jgi:phosphoglycerate dehydrogenase-like enzyme
MKLLITVNWNRKALERMAAEFPAVEFVTATADEAMVSEIADAEIVFGRITREAFVSARQLRWIQCQGAGVETMAEIPEIAESGVIVTNTRGAHARTIAEHAFGMLIALARGFRSLFKAQEAGVWKRPLDAPMVGLSGLTMGVIGLGNIGRAIARRAHAFEMTVIAVDAEDVPRPEYVAEVRRLDGLPDLLDAADVVVVSAPYTPVTARMLDGERLRLLKPTAYLIVVSRGGIVDEEALAVMLREGKLAGAGVDVTDVEPLPSDSPLWSAPNLILTPHCSGQSRQTTETALAILRENLARYLAGEPLQNLVDIRRGY